MAAGKHPPAWPAPQPRDVMYRVSAFLLLPFAAGWAIGVAAAAQDASPQAATRQPPDPQAAAWPMERIEMLDGAVHEGYIESQDAAWINLIQIRGGRTRPTHLVIRPIERSQIASVVRLDEQQRARLRERIEQFINRARIEAAGMDAAHLETITEEGRRRYQYRGKWFSLDSSADESTTRRIIVRVEQIFTAYRQIIAPRTDSQRPLRLVVLASMPEYKAYLERLGIALQNPACFIPQQNVVVAGSDMARLSTELAKVNVEHARLEAELARLEKQMPGKLAEISREMRKKSGSAPHNHITKALLSQRRELEEQIKKKRSELQRVDRENDRTFQNVTGQMLSRLYHEALHAYLENYVYPRARHDVPLWLNEGLAQMFEAGWLESGSFRIDGPNPEALKALKADLVAPSPLPWEKVLTASQAEFLGGSDAGRYYAYAWGLTYYLEFEHHVLGSAALDRYVEPASKGGDAVERFQKLMGMPIDKFAATWREYILQLR